MSWLVLKMVLSLAAVLGVMAGLLWVVRRLPGVGRPGGDAAVRIDLLGHRTLGPKRSVRVLRIFDSIIVIGETESGITTLAEFDDAATLLSEATEAQSAQKDGIGKLPKPFPSALREALLGIMRRDDGTAGRASA